MTYVEKLQDVIRKLHDCESNHVSTVPINPEKPWLGFVGTWRLHFMRQALRRDWEGRDSQTFGGTSEAAARRYVVWMTAQGL